MFEPGVAVRVAIDLDRLVVGLEAVPDSWSNSATMRRLVACPIRLSSAPSLRKLLHVHLAGDSRALRDTGSISRSKSARSVRWFLPSSCDLPRAIGFGHRLGRRSPSVGPGPRRSLAVRPP